MVHDAGASKISLLSKAKKRIVGVLDGLFVISRIIFYNFLEDAVFKALRIG